MPSTIDINEFRTVAILKSNKMRDSRIEQKIKMSPQTQTVKQSYGTGKEKILLCQKTLAYR